MRICRTLAHGRKSIGVQSKVCTAARHLFVDFRRFSGFKKRSCFHTKNLELRIPMQ
jgi:hypothetical protein